ncbi:MAG: hypothetical protein A2915_04735 [Candidatus Yanofskybacteria bacterium RIFCSPLOWO2_01_FULL_41_34]|uniref:Polyprenol-phosphate-mannose--protein mannosyltransferase n=1 Tax=Candidatus Yanofskybacteria bacterium RIFCSPHIGHO2_01_FULL_41_26 TaxID=1802661 RepID=A0A1F8EDS8_9BACT|nr:MAG: hypothetical protein A2649_04315 [Candidatus Yanofskybacteria bacterium RIFCSPHIGHO2_01_FULL_41_26]OGN21994.1 MAG: hypothetical protein A2915_04735 [Candidatus Yanofskybacteria bacterium RIFCSPLOWO2_01_FULL_41_34]
MKKGLLIITLLSATTHFAFFSYPNQTVFDEVHFGKFISGYYTHEYYFDIHPPLGKLMVAGFAKIFDFKPDLPDGKAGFSFAQIGEKFPDEKYLALRFLPSLAGALLPVVIFLLALQLKFTPIGAFVAGFLVAIENALIVQTHFILMDGFLLIFGFLTLLFYFKLRYTLHASRYKILMAIFGGLTISIKWTGLTFLALPLIIETWSYLKNRSFERFIRQLIFFVIIPLMIYFSVFALHFSLLTKPGPGDAFMSPNFRKENVVKKFVELNIQMYQSNQRLTATHPYGSRWYSWPFMARPIFYWVSENSRIYLLGNPIIWWGSTVAILLSLGYVTRHRIIQILLAGYFLNLLPFVGIKRVMFLYHYLAALVFAILILVYLIERQRHAKKIFIGLAVASAVAFVYFTPLTYGLPLSPKTYESRVWLPSWE